MTSGSTMGQVLKLTATPKTKAATPKAVKATRSTATKTARSHTPDAGKWVHEGLQFDAQMLRAHHAKLGEHGSGEGAPDRTHESNTGCAGSGHR